MTSRRNLAISLALLGACVAVRADLGRWIQDIAPSRLQAVFFRPVVMPGGPVSMRRPPQETRAELSRLISTAPNDADLYALRAREAEQQLDFTAAENDWKKHVELASNKPAAELNQARLSLADFYHRRLRPREEVAALDSAGRSVPTGAERFLPAAGQQSWITFARIQNVIADQALPTELAVAEYRAWITRYPEPTVYQTFLSYLVVQKQFTEAERLIAEYRKAFPSDLVFPITSSASLAAARGSSDQALKIYDQSFQPLWPPELIKSYFDVLKQSHSLRRYLESARNQVSASPSDIGPAARIYYYYQQQGNLTGALRALYEYRQRKESHKSAYTADELFTLAQLFEGAHNYDEAARSYYALYNSTGTPDQERALAGLANVLLAAPEQQIQFGSGDLSYYRDIATMDPGPGFLNGILSLILNSTAAQSQYSTENQASVAYFHRARASELITLLDSRFPNSKERAALHAKLIEAYATYSDDAGILRAGREFLTSFPQASQRTQVAAAIADAYARQNKTQEEFAIYNELLNELAVRANSVPLGRAAPQTPTEPKENGAAATFTPARSPEYAQILDRYIARLVALKRITAALALYRREIDRNPNDPGLYERFAAFLDQNKLGADVEQIYRRAMAQFQDRTWSEKLARWYLRRKQTAQFEQLTREVVKIFSGTELEQYFQDVSKGQPIAPILYRQVNLYARERFPYDLAFVRNLLGIYSRRGTANPVAREALLRSYWYYADDLRDQFFELLARTGKLKTELAALNSTSDKSPWATRFLAEAENWQSHFEVAAPLLKSLTVDYPGDVHQNMRAAAVFRSLATYDLTGDLHNTETAAQIEQQISRFDPRDSTAITRTGEVYADRELFNRARPFWNGIPIIAPGRADGYVEAATIFWDYYRFDDALRLIAQGRQKLGRPELYSYEAGAIYENQRDYARAVQEYAKGALAQPEDSQSKARLITLARRSQQRALIEDLTARQAAVTNAGIPAISLRVSVLNAQDRRSDLEQFLVSAADRSTSIDVLQYIDSIGATYGFDSVEERSKSRQILLTTDPVERMQAQLAFMRYWEGRHDLASAGRIADELYRNNATVLGVVRATADFYWRNKNFKRSIDTLVQAAAKAQPSYRDPFTLEAARKSTESGDYTRARTLLANLLKENPFQAQYVAAMADTFAREGDDRGLREFYTARLNSIASARLPAPDKIARATALRRGLIPVLTNLKDYAGALDHYIEILNRYAEDEELAREAARYASSHGRAQQLLAFYDQASKNSPRDFRWPLVEARLQTNLENFPAAVAAYAKAEAIRPDRVDFYTATAGLQERLLRFDDAAATYAKLYDLSYRNSQWMEKFALVRARQGQTDATIKALEAAFIQGKPARPENLFSVARRLESWDMLPQARDFAEKGLTLGGTTLLTDYQSGAQLYIRIMTRLRQYGAAFTRLSALPPAGLETAVQQMGPAVAEYFSPEEKAAFARFVSGPQPKTPLARMQLFLPAVKAAGLTDIEAKWLYALLIAKPAEQSPAALIDLEQRRLQFDELGAQLEGYWKALPAESENRDSYLDQAARNFQLAANTTGELRVLAMKAKQGSLNGPLLDRYAELLTRSPQKLSAAASSDPSEDVRNSIANYVIKSGNAERAFDALSARGRGLPPVWTRSYTALTGLYFATNTPTVNAAFRDALGTAATIGDRLVKPIDRTQQLAGDTWFYYGSRFGEFLAVTKQNDSEDYLPAMLENRPGSADAYFQLAEYYRETGQAPRALEQLHNTLQLDSRRGDAHAKVAAILWQQGKHDEARVEWKAALDAFARQQDERKVPEMFWSGLRATLEDIGNYRQLSALRDLADRILRTYVRRNGDFRAEELMQGALVATGNPAAGVQWIIDLSKAAPEPSLFLAGMVSQEWVPEAQRPVLYRALIESAKLRVARSQGEAQSAADTDLHKWQIEFITYSLAHQTPQEAQAVFSEIPVDIRKTRASEVIPLEVQIAAQAGSLKALLDRYSGASDLPLYLEFLRNGANELQKAGDPSAARQVLAFVYTRQLDQHDLTPATFLGLAEIRLQEGDTNGALTLLRRMALVAGEPFANLKDAAALLAKLSHSAEAVEFLKQRVQAVPWDSDARVKLAAAEAPPSSPSAVFPATAQKPYDYAARIAVASSTNDLSVKIRLLREAIAINPAPEKPRFDLVKAAIAAKRWQTAVACASGLPYTDVSFILALADANEHLRNLREAEQLYQSAKQLDSRNATAVRQIRIIQAQLKREERNEARRPVVTANLEQDHVVRPRITGEIE